MWDAPVASLCLSISCWVCVCAFVSIFWKSFKFFAFDLSFVHTFATAFSSLKFTFIRWLFKSRKNFNAIQLKCLEMLLFFSSVDVCIRYLGGCCFFLLSLYIFLFSHVLYVFHMRSVLSVGAENIRWILSNEHNYK